MQLRPIEWSIFRFVGCVVDRPRVFHISRPHSEIDCFHARSWGEAGMLEAHRHTCHQHPPLVVLLTVAIVQRGSRYRLQALRSVGQARTINQLTNQLTTRQTQTAEPAGTAFFHTLHPGCHRRETATSTNIPYAVEL